jgi:hypothetical protein
MKYDCESPLWLRGFRCGLRAAWRHNKLMSNKKYLENVAKSLLNYQISTIRICKLTRLPLEEIKALKASRKGQKK